VPTTRFWNSFLQIHSTYIKFNVVMFDSSDLVCLCSIFTHSYLFLQLRNMDLKVFIVISSLCWKYNANDGCLQWSRHCLLLWSIWVHHRVLVWSWCSIFSFLCGVLSTFSSLFLLAIVMFVLLRFTSSDYPFGIFIFFLLSFTVALRLKTIHL
jgi:hypothetical protein